MITQYFEINQRQVIQAPGTLAPATLQPWVYADNYNLAIYLVSQGNIQPIGPTDTLSLMLFQPVQTLPEQNLAIVSTPIIKTDTTGQNYYQVNVNLATVPLANLVQTNNTPAKCEFHYIFTPATGERFSSSADVAVTVNPDPTKDATGATPVPPAYPTNPNVFEMIANKGVINGYAALDGTGKVPAAQLPASTTGGDMLKSVYDTNNNGIVDTCDTIQSSRVIGLGTAAIQNTPASGNASTSQVVLGSDTRLTDTRTPIPHQTTHNGGSDPIPLASPSAQGLCPTLDGTTIQVVSGKLVATTTGNGDMLKSVFATNNPLNTTGIVDNALSVQTHQVPTAGNASGAQLVLATDTRLSDSRNPLPHQATHLVGGADPITLASAAAAGLCPAVDNVTIQVSASKLAAILATATAPGIVKPDGTTITISGGTISAAAGGIGAHGCRITHSVQVAIAANTETVLPFDTDQFNTDSSGYHSISTNNSRITIPTGQAGYYLIGACVLFDALSTDTYRSIEIYLNTQLYPIVQQSLGTSGSTPSTSSNGAYASLSTVINMNVGDYVQLKVWTGVAQHSNKASTLSPYGSPVFYAMRIA